MQLETLSRLAFRARLLSTLALTALLAACGSSESEKLKAARLTEGCALNSECESPLICAFERCHRECEEDRDCPSTERCVRNDRGYVCQLEVETVCKRNGDCSPSQVCGDDGECRDECDSSDDCTKGQVCAKSKECASMSAEKDTLDAQMNILPQKTSTDKASAGASGGNSGASGQAGASGKPTEGKTSSGVTGSDQACSMTGSKAAECKDTSTSESEPNNMKSEATPICIGETVSGEIAEMDNVDTYRIVTPSHSSGGYLIVTLNPSKSQLDLFVRNGTEAATQGGYARAPADGEAHMWVATAPSVSYLIDVKPILSGSPYTLNTEWKAIEDCFEPNDDRMNAKPIELDAPITAYFHAGVLETGTGKYADWYELTLEPGSLVVRFDEIPSNIVGGLELYDAKGARLKVEYSTTAGALVELTATVPEAGKYTVAAAPRSNPLFADNADVLPSLTTPYKLTATQP